MLSSTAHDVHTKWNKFKYRKEVENHECSFYMEYIQEMGKKKVYLHGPLMRHHK